MRAAARWDITRIGRWAGPPANVRPGMGAQVLVGPVGDGDAEDRALQQPAPLEPVERPEGHHPREVTTDAEDDEDVRRGFTGRAWARAWSDCSAHTATVLVGSDSAITSFG